MKQTNKEFNALYNQYDTVLEAGGNDMATTYQKVLKKAGLTSQRRIWKQSSKILLVAAILAATTTTVAAAVYGVKDAFRDVLNIHSSADPNPDTNSILDRTGLLINETEQSGTVDISLRAAVGDERTLKILVDVVDHSGKGLAIMQSNGTLSDNSFGLKTYDITKANGDPLAGSSNYSFINIDPANNKFTILFDYAITGDVIQNETLKLHFEDILQSATLDGTPLNMTSDSLYQIVSSFGQYGDSEFQLSSRQENKNFYLLHVADSNVSVPLCNEYPEIKVTAATVKDGSLYLQGTAGSSEQLDKILNNAALRNHTGDAVQMSEISRNDENNWSIRFDGIESLESLKGYIWNYDAGDHFHTAYEGTWDFTFKADIENLAVKMTPNIDTTWEGYDLTVNTLEISPYSLFLQYSTDENTALRMFPDTEWGTMQTSDWMESYHPIVLTMKDGSTVEVNGGSLAPEGGNLAMVPAGTVITRYEMQYQIDVVIDPAQVSSIQIGNQTISVQQ